ncbi:Serine/threonine-protein kinase cst-1 [Diplonema papillatum]|nr:Serine/threonine-protein kinase cst-1 [Diplonema papillatum]|eukprot:gene2837-4444_t
MAGGNTRTTLRERLLNKDLITIGDIGELYEGKGPNGDIESFFRGGGVDGLGSRIFKGWVKGDSAKPVALKQLFFSDGKVNTEGPCTVEDEIKILKALQSEHAVQFLGAYMSTEIDDELWIVTEFCEGGSVAETLRDLNAPLSETHIRGVISDVLAAVRHLHTMGYLHRDIRCENILLSRNARAILADFGSVAVVPKAGSVTGVVGSSHWMAPELAAGQAYNEKADIWSVGISVLEMAETTTPLQREGCNETATAVYTPKFISPELWSAELVSFLSSCLHMDPAKRSTVKELQNFPFVKAKKPDDLVSLVHEIADLREARDEAEKKAALNRVTLDDTDDENESTYGETPSTHPSRTPEQNSLTHHKDSIHFDPVVSPPPAIHETTPLPQSLSGPERLFNGSHRNSSGHDHNNSVNSITMVATSSSLSSPPEKPHATPPAPAAIPRLGSADSIQEDAVLRGRSAGHTALSLSAAPADRDELLTQNEELRRQIEKMRAQLPYPILLQDEISRSQGSNFATNRTKKEAADNLKRERVVLEEQAENVKMSLTTLKGCITQLSERYQQIHQCLERERSTVSSVGTDIGRNLSRAASTTTRQTTTPIGSPVDLSHTMGARGRTFPNGKRTATTQFSSSGASTPHATTNYTPGSLRKNALSKRLRPANAKRTVPHS